MTDRIRVERERDGRVLTLVIDHPKGNVLDRRTMLELDAVLAEHAADGALKLVTLRGAGRHFSFGASIEEHRPAEAASMLATFHALVRHVARYPVPVVALVDGRCLGGAFELVLCCHFVLATQQAVFACPEIQLGVVPPVLAALGAWRLGAPAAERLVLTGGELDAAEARRLGLVSEIVAAGDDLALAASRFYDARLAGLSAFALREAVAALRETPAVAALLDEGLAAAEHRYLERIVPSYDGNEGIEAFLEKRAPVWRDA